MVVGIVTDNADPENLGRVKVKYPWLAADAVSSWARLAAPGAGKDYGIAWLPQVDDEVLVAFAHGDVGEPYVLGGLWNGIDKPPTANVKFDAGKVSHAVMKSRKGHEISRVRRSRRRREHHHQERRRDATRSRSTRPARSCTSSRTASSS